MPGTHRSSDFTRMEEPSHTLVPDKDAAWTDTETLLLLEGLENFDTNWDEVANHVGTRTREECVMKFLQLEIQDQYMEDGPGSIEYRALGGREPISQLENPVMSVVSFLAQMHDPAIVAAASQRTVEQMHKDLRKELEKGMGTDTKPSEDASKENQETSETSKDGDVKAEDSMDVDTSSKPAESQSQSSPHVLTDLSTTALAVSAARSAALATHEEREATRLVSAAMNLTLKKYELKLAQFAEMEEIVQAERRDLEKGRQQLFLDQLRFRKRVKEVENQLKQISMSGNSNAQESLRTLTDTMRDGMMSAGFGFANGGRSEVMPLSGDGDVASVDI